LIRIKKEATTLRSFEGQSVHPYAKGKQRLLRSSEQFVVWTTMCYIHELLSNKKITTQREGDFTSGSFVTRLVFSILLYGE
jgi:hypothetical protein